MRHHSIICRLGPSDRAVVNPSQVGAHVTELGFIDGYHRLGFGLGQAIDQLQKLGLRPSETAVDLGLLAAAVTAADTRISRKRDAEDAWTRAIDLHLPVQDPDRWSGLTPLVIRTLNFLTGDHWGVHFRPRPANVPELATTATQLRTANPSCICLFSGGLDSFIGAIDLLAAGEDPLFVSHYWDGVTSTHQEYCAVALKRRLPGIAFHHVRARVGFPKNTIDAASTENTQRGRSFLFFALAGMAADAVGGEIDIHVPENGLISLNVPLDPLRLGALSTRTTHPYYMARFDELLAGLGLSTRLLNRYDLLTKGQMVAGCADKDFLKQESRHTMSCSSPAKARWAQDEADRQPKHCGHCVPCLIRRAAMLEGFGSDDTEYQVPDLHARVLHTSRAEGRDIRSFQVALSRLRSKPARARLDIHRPGPLSDHPERLADYEAVYVAGLNEVGRLLRGVTARGT